MYAPPGMGFRGCSEDGVVPDVGQGTDVPEGMHEVEVTFNMGTSGDIQTRSVSRPVISSDNWQRVSNVRIYVFRSENGGEDNSSYTYYKPSVRQADGTILNEQPYFLKIGEMIRIIRTI